MAWRTPPTTFPNLAGYLPESQPALPLATSSARRGALPMCDVAACMKLSTSHSLHFDDRVSMQRLA